MVDGINDCINGHSGNVDMESVRSCTPSWARVGRGRRDRGVDDSEREGQEQSPIEQRLMVYTLATQACRLARSLASQLNLRCAN